MYYEGAMFRSFTFAAFLAVAAFAAAERQSVAFVIQGMTCTSCVKEVTSGLGRVPTVKNFKLSLSPPVARFTIDTQKVSLQDVIRAVRKAGGAFDGKVLLREDPKLPDSKLEALDRALEQVTGVKNTGAPDENGLREITLDLKKKTSLDALLKAGRSVGVVLSVPGK
jgi:copper chaperone CopZ